MRLTFSADNRTQSHLKYLVTIIERFLKTFPVRSSFNFNFKVSGSLCADINGFWIRTSLPATQLVCYINSEMSFNSFFHLIVSWAVHWETEGSPAPPFWRPARHSTAIATVWPGLCEWNFQKAETPFQRKNVLQVFSKTLKTAAESNSSENLDQEHVNHNKNISGHSLDKLGKGTEPVLENNGHTKSFTICTVV